ncbi:MAG: hypothetical protein L0287_32735 [Anaerolineae bacterium]|nr:hypothetical protein [Anaerolineae bacterium]
MSKTFPLSKEIAGHKGAIKEITLREPTFNELCEYDSFMQPDGGFNWKILRKWLSRLSGIDDVVLGAMAPRDLWEMVGWLDKEMAPAKNSE